MGDKNRKLFYGDEFIANERQEQVEKHGRTIDKDVDENKRGELRLAARLLLKSRPRINMPPRGWDKDIWRHLAQKPVKERCIIAGALLAAEIDRLNLNDWVTEARKILKSKYNTKFIGLEIAFAVGEWEDGVTPEEFADHIRDYED